MGVFRERFNEECVMTHDCGCKQLDLSGTFQKVYFLCALFSWASLFKFATYFYRCVGSAQQEAIVTMFLSEQIDDWGCAKMNTYDIITTLQYFFDQKLHSVILINCNLVTWHVMSKQGTWQFLSLLIGLGAEPESHERSWLAVQLFSYIHSIFLYK